MDKQVQELQNEVKLLKNEIKEVLTDIRSVLLTNLQNPFPTEYARETPAPNSGMMAPQVQNGGNFSSQMPQMPTSMPIIQLTQGLPQTGQVPFAGPVQNGGAVNDAPNNGAAHPGNRNMINSQANEIVEEPHKAPMKVEKAQSEMQSEQTQASGALSAKENEVNNHHSSPNGKKESAKATEKTDNSNRSLSSPNVKKEIAKPMDVRSSQLERELEVLASNEQIDLLTVITMASWVENSARKIGQDKLRTVVEIYGTMGAITPQMQQLLLKMVSLDDGESTEKGRLKDCWRVLLDMDSMFRKQ